MKRVAVLIGLFVAANAAYATDCLDDPVCAVGAWIDTLAQIHTLRAETTVEVDWRFDWDGSNWNALSPARHYSYVMTARQDLVNKWYFVHEPISHVEIACNEAGKHCVLTTKSLPYLGEVFASCQPDKVKIPSLLSVVQRYPWVFDPPHQFAPELDCAASASWVTVGPYTSCVKYAQTIQTVGGVLTLYEAWLDSEIGYCPRQIKEYSQRGDLMKVVSGLDYLEVSPGVYFPVSGIVSTVDEGLTISTETLSVNVATLQVNQPMSPADFVIVPPSGTRIIDYTANPPLYLLASTKTLPALMDDSVRLVKADPKVTRWVGPTYRWSLAGIFGIVSLLVTCWAARRLM